MANFCEALASWSSSAVISEVARAEARLAFLDTFGCMVAGWNEPQTSAVRIAFGNDVTSPSSTSTALILGTAAHALDFDDYETPGSTHPSAPILGAILGLLQSSSRPVDDLLDAYITGFETIVRLGETLRYDHYNAGWHSTGTLGTIGAAAASARVLQLDTAAFAHAIAISASLASGLKAQFGTDTKAMHAGFAARAGVEAARLAQAGATGMLSIFEGRFGFAQMHQGAGSDFASARTRARQKLGIEEYSILRKPWPSCAYTHRVIEAGLALHSQTKDAAKATRILIRMPEPFFRVSGFVFPTTPNEARFSATYCALAALLDGQISPASFEPKAFLRPQIAELLSRTEIDAYNPGPDMDDMSPAHPDSVTLYFQDGRSLSESVSIVRGGPSQPMSSAELRSKFTACGGDEEAASTILNAGGTSRLTLSLDRLGFSLAQTTSKE